MLIFSPTSALTSVDFPTDGRPTIAICPARCAVAVRSAMCRAGNDARERSCGGILLGSAPARSAAACCHRQRRDSTVDFELLRVRLACRRDDSIFGHRVTARLQPFLQARLRILAERCRVGSMEQISVNAVNRCACSQKSPVEKHCAQHRFERIGDDRRSIGAAALQLAVAEPNVRTEPYLPCELRERIAVHEIRARARKITFLRRRKSLEQGQGDDAIQHRIADELESFVVGYAEAAVCEGLAQEAGLAKIVTEPFRQCHSAKNQREADASKSSKMLALPIIGSTRCHEAVAVIAPPCLDTCTSL